MTPFYCWGIDDMAHPIRIFLLSMLLLGLAVGCVGVPPLPPTQYPIVCDDPLGCVHIMPDDPVLVGVLQVSSGETAPLGITQYQAIELAAKDRDNQLLGYPIELQQEDTQCTSEGGANAALRLVANPQVVGLLGTACSGAAVGIVPIMSEAGLVMISGLNTAPSLTSVNGVAGDNQYDGYYRVIPSGVNVAEAAAKFAYDELGVRTIGTVNDGDAFTLELAKAFENTFTELGGTVELSAIINKGDRDMIPLLEAVMLADVELLFVPIFQPEADSIVLQSSEYDALDDLLFMGVPSLLVDPFIRNVRETIAGRMYFSNPHTFDTPQYQTLHDAYEAAYGDPLHGSYPYGYDSANLLFDALESTTEVLPDGSLLIRKQALRDALQSTENFAGITGNLTCDAFGDCAYIHFDIFHLANPDDTIETVLENRVYTYQPDSDAMP